jgi:outer membrane protein
MKKVIIAFFVFTAIVVGALYFFTKGNDKKIVYADAIRLFNGYKFKVELEKMGQGTLTMLKNRLDSVEVIYKANPTDERGQQLVAEGQQRLAEAYTAINKEINQKAWERLNPIINKFGKEKGIDLLIGANGMGTVLYATEARDVTDELIIYANGIYDKGN